MGQHSKPSNRKRVVAAAAVTGGLVAVPMLGAANANAASMSDWNSVAACEASGDWSINYSGDGLSVGGLQFQNASWQDALSYLSSRGYDTSSFPQSLYQGMPRSSVPTENQQILAGEALLHLQGAGAWTTVSDGCASLGTSMFDGGPNPWGLPGTQWPGDASSQGTPSGSSGGSTQASGGSGSSSGSPSGVPGTHTPGEAEDGDSDQAVPTAPPRSDAGGPATGATAKVTVTTPLTGSSTVTVMLGQYTVQPGDWLIRIAEQYYGSANWDKWTVIYDANKAVVGSNPNLIYPGQVLQIPKLAG